ncbi:MAG: replication initiation protein [Rickettsia endosymbiont of Ixodes persulcatus]|nr:replication initiation protein [Rickettsia endosymbiont of Ixodes persulcatus]
MNQSTVLAQKRSLELKKHVGLIHSANHLSLLERKIANALLYNAYDNLLVHNEHYIHIPTLCGLIGYNSNDYKTIKRSLISLISTVLEWNLVDKTQENSKDIWMASAMLADAKIEGPLCTYSYSNRLKELCYRPEFYGRLSLKVLSLFKSTYGLALYENCIRYQSITQTPWFTIPTYRKLMGIGEGKYELFRDLNRRVIKPAVTEVNRYSPIRVTAEIKKQGRVLAAIRFLISKPYEDVSVQLQKNATLADRLKNNYGFSTIQLEKLLSSYSETYLIEKMNLIESSPSYQNGKIKHLAKYLEKALLEDYQPPKSSREHIENLHLKQKEKAEARQRYGQTVQLYHSYQMKKLWCIYSEIPEKRRKAIVNAFTKHVSTTLYHTIFMKEGLDNPIVRDRFVEFLNSSYPDLKNSLLSFENFCKQKDLLK